MRLLILGFGLTCVIFLGGCVTHYNFYKSGVTSQEREQDNYECQKESTTRQRGGIGGARWDDEVLNRGLWVSCLRARGYSVTEE